ncbi:MAG: hypothetical protein ACFFCE_07345 [Promethearchaeota archaeon]
MNFEDFVDLIDNLIEKFTREKKKKFLILEEYIDHGILQKRNPEFLFVVYEKSKYLSEMDVLDEELEVVKVGVKIKLYTKSSEPNNRKLFLEMEGEEVVEKLKHLRRLINCGCIKPPGTLFRDKEHYKIKIDGIIF